MLGLMLPLNWQSRCPRVRGSGNAMGKSDIPSRKNLSSVRAVVAGSAGMFGVAHEDTLVRFAVQLVDTRFLT